MSEVKRIKAYKDMLRKAAEELDKVYKSWSGRYDEEGKSKVVIEIENLLKQRKF